MNNTFDIKRLYNFIIRQASLNLTPSLIGIGGVFGLLLIIFLLIARFQPENFGAMFALSMVVFFAGGVIITSRVFSELSSPAKSYSFQTLPVSNLEKIIGSWLISSPIYVIVYTSLLVLIYTISTFSTGIPFSLVNFFSASFPDIIAVYLVIQTVFFLGACTFKNYNLLKTLLSIFLLFVIILSFTALVGYIFFQGSINSEDVNLGFKADAEYTATTILPAIFWYGLAPFLLIVSYYKLKEREV